MHRHVDVFFIVVYSMWNLLPTNSESLKELCTSYLTQDHKMFESPSKDKPVKIFYQFDIIDIGEINEESMDYLFYTFLSMVWKDPRIQVKEFTENETIPVYLPKDCLPYFWQPDIFFETAKTIETFKSSSPHISLQVFSDGKILLQTRYLFRCSCHMMFHHYPFDTQVCEFYISNVPPDSVAILHWMDEKQSPISSAAINLLNKIEPLQYTLERIDKHKNVDILPDANYTSLIVDFILHRRFIGSLIDAYIPSTLIVCMSWTGFWLGVDAVPARVSLSITSLLTLSTQAQRYQSQLPPVNYIKAMDIWLFVCIFVVFSTLIEFAVAHNIRESHKKNEPGENRKESVLSESKEALREQISRNLRTDSEDQLFKKVVTVGSPSIISKTCAYLKTKWRNKTADEICQLLYPVSFLVFVIFYFTYYLKIFYNPNYSRKELL